jgi:glycosyltransferase involved in cell wall biosynthesis
MILYKRDETISSPQIKASSLLKHPSVELQFNFKMPSSLLSEAMCRAVESLGQATNILYPSQNRPLPILYHQSNTLLTFTPRHLPFFVTHHGPFAEDICRLFGRRFASDAFQGGEGKVDHLLKMQARGLATLCKSDLGAALELSNVQEHLLLQYGVPRTKIFRTIPPITTVGTVCGLRSSPSQDNQNIELITAVARSDRFKNLELLIDAANDLLRQGANLRLTIFAGPEEEEVNRRKLRSRLVDDLQPRTLVAPRLSHDNLLKYLTDRRDRAIFVCTSIYETFGITPFEAMLSGMVTIIPDEPLRIGVLEYLPPENRFQPTIEGLVKKLKELILSPNLRLRRYQQIEQAVRLINAHNFPIIFRRASNYLLNRIQPR